MTLVLVAGALPVPGQTSTPSPEELWSFDPEGDATINDVGIDAEGTILAAVQADAGIQETDDDELFYWDLDRSKTNPEPRQSHDPRAAPLTDPEGMGVVAVEPAVDGKANLIAVGNEGSSGSSANNRIYIYSVSSGPEAYKAVSYPSDTSPPSGAVQDLWFLNDGNHLLAYHSNAIDLFQKRNRDHEFNHQDRWTPGEGESLESVAVSRDSERILVGTVESRTGQSDLVHLRTLDRSGNDLQVTSNDETWTKGSATVGISADGRYALFGAGDGALFYFHLQEAQGEDHQWNFSSPWTDSRSGSITAVALSPDGAHFAAGFSNDRLRVYERIAEQDTNPVADLATRGAFETAGSPSQITFAGDGDRIFVLAGAVYGFHARQFDTDQELTALWVVPGATGLDVSHSGDRFIVATPNTVRAFEQAYEATLDAQGPGTVDPGQPFTLDVRVANTGSAFDRYSFSTEDVPGSWSTEVTPSELSLLPGENGTVQLNLTPHAAQAPGDITFTVVANSELAPDGRQAGSQEVTVNVREVRSAQVSLDVDQAEVNRGQPAVLNARIQNTGNVADGVTVEVDQDAGWGVSIGEEPGDRRTFQLDPQQSQDVAITLEVPSDASEGSTNTVTLTARPESGGTQGEAMVDLVVDPAYGGTITGPTSAQDVEPGEQATFTVTIENTGNTRDMFSVTASSNASNPDHVYEATVSPATFEMDGGATRDLTVTVNVPRAAEPGDSAEVTVSVRSDGVGSRTDSATFDVRVPEDTDDSPLPFLAPLALALAALRRRRQDG